MISQAPKPRKSRRNPRPCDSCSRRGVKCKPSDEDQTRCQNCADFDEPCTNDRPMRKRGVRAGSSRSNSAIEPASTVRDSLDAIAIDPHISSFQDIQDTVLQLANVFFEVIFPIFPLFHKPSLLRKIASREHLHNPALFTTVAAVCALSSARIRDGAVYTPNGVMDVLTEHSSEYFFVAAEEALPKSAALTQELGYMQACILLSVTSIQYGNSVKARYYLNLYHAFVAVGFLHDEDEWPQGLSSVETEERRRLFWSAYTLDVFTSMIWKGTVRSSELAFNVCYPTEHDLLHDTASMPSMCTSTTRPSWLEGWNFVTDLYRLLEHVLHRLRPKSRRTPVIGFEISQDNHSLDTSLLERVTAMYDRLPAIFKSAHSPTNDMSKDLYSFQAANIAATVQLLRMVLFTIKGSSVEDKCQIASEVIRVFSSIPIAYLRAISSPLLHHLAGIGVLVGSTFHERLSESAYHRIQSVLLDFAALIASLEAGMHHVAGVSDRLRAQVTTLDKYWTDQRQHQSVPQSRRPLHASGPSESSGFADFESSHSPFDYTQGNSISFPSELFEDWESLFDLT